LDIHFKIYILNYYVYGNEIIDDFLMKNIGTIGFIKWYGPIISLVLKTSMIDIRQNDIHYQSLIPIVYCAQHRK